MPQVRSVVHLSQDATTRASPLPRFLLRSAVKRTVRVFLPSYSPPPPPPPPPPPRLLLHHYRRRHLNPAQLFLLKSLTARTAGVEVRAARRCRQSWARGSICGWSETRQGDKATAAGAAPDVTERLDLVPAAHGERLQRGGTESRFYCACVCVGGGVGLWLGCTDSTTRGTSEDRESVTWLASGVARVNRFRYLKGA